MDARTILLATLIAALPASCTVSDKSPHRVLKPEGEKVSLTVASGLSHSGELLCTTEDALYFQDAGKIRVVETRNLGKVRVGGYDLVVRKDFAGSLRAYARYPDCPSEQQWRALLDHYGQAEIERIPP